MAANSNRKPQNELLEPCILACGYRQISIVKTNNKFPAWLVLIPSPDNTCWGEVIAPNEDSRDDSAPQWSCYWRSKRDFLLLSRSLAASGSKNENIQCSCSGPRLKLRTLPKAPFQKLCDRSPWRRPLLVNNSLTKDTNRDTLQECLMNPVVLDEVWKKPKNEYHASMTKNLSQMDQFLQAVHRHTSCVSDKCGCVLGVQKTSGEEGTMEAFQKAWKLFCRPIDCEEIVATSENNTLLEPLGSSLPTPQSLGQYFCTPENSTQLIGIMLKKLSQLQASHSPKKKRLVILEPSCGHGNIIWALLEQQLDHLLKHYNTVSIVGIDLDPRVIDVCQKRYTSLPEVENKSKLSLQFFCQSFLTSKLQDFVKPHEWSSTIVVAIGGPPYGSKPEERNLPQQFVQHCMKEWDCQVIAFLVPQRFRTSLADIATNDDDLTYACHSEELAHSTFLFKGKTAVKQPSRIQCYYRVVEVTDDQDTSD